MFWTILSPLATIMAFSFVFSLVLRIAIKPEETGTDKFVVFFLCGFFPWNLLATSLNKAVGVLVSESMIITKVVFPVELLPISVVLSTFLINGIGFILLLLYLGVTGYFNFCWLAVPLALLVQAVFITGLALFFSSLCVFFRDIGELLSIVIMLWFYGTPVIYPISMVPARFEFLYSFNPMVSFVQFYRQAILLNVIDLRYLGIMCGCAMVSYALGSWFFVRSRSAFGDVL